MPAKFKVVNESIYSRYRCYQAVFAIFLRYLYAEYFDNIFELKVNFVDKIKYV